MSRIAIALSNSGHSDQEVKETIKDQIWIALSFNNGYREMNKNTTKKTIPKLLFELILIFSILVIYIFVKRLYQWILD